ncbi:hypothetical protein [Hymenobacter cheonanensis]|uniref:hypothetical protein n=1 Tax=Hymenobacter sp. CA2-7 TaxID=3063993 RepID=UPI0027130BCC|nr:hypothetical protein [Hymenobacter sp. CA2-7]MDO7886746.1 hypothetical protein [Hymenobacter sp. CA2-7]
MADLMNVLPHAPLLLALATAPLGGKILIGLLILFLGLAPSLGGTALEISADCRQYRAYYSLFGLKFGRWQPLPPVVGVTLKYFSTVSTRRSKYSWNATTSHHEEIVVLLSVRNSVTGMTIERFSADDVNTAIDFAHDMADRFNVPVNQYLPPHLYQPLPPATGSQGPA